MTKIERMEGPRRALPAPGRRADANPRAKRVDPAPLPSAAVTQSHAGLGQTPLTTTRPLAAFLAQYVDQHWPWGSSSFLKEERRLKAASAYLTAEMLPDQLAGALDASRTQRKL
jgi:hypothetical protein